MISADTAISMMAVNAKQELVGGVILPGPQLSLSALVKNTAQLPQIDLAAKAPASILGKSTSSCLQNGFVLGTASLLDGLAERFCAELGPQTAFYATGNLPIPIREACRTPILYRETLITDGLYRIWMKNKKDNSNPPGALKKKNQNTDVFYGFQDSSIFPWMNSSPLVRHSYRLTTAG